MWIRPDRNGRQILILPVMQPKVPLQLNLADILIFIMVQVIIIEEDIKDSQLNLKLIW